MARNPLFEAIDNIGTSARVRMAMYMGTKLESGWRADAVGDGGNSIGYYQINLPYHPSMNRAKAQDPVASTRYMLSRYENGVNKVNSSMWSSDPWMAAAYAAYYAERPAKFYGRDRVRNAQPSVERVFKGGSGSGDSGGSVGGGALGQVPGSGGNGGGVIQAGIADDINTIFGNLINRIYFGILIGGGALIMMVGLYLLFREYTNTGSIAGKTKDAFVSVATLGKK